MTEEEQNYNDKLLLLAGISLPGLIGKMQFMSPLDIAIQAFDIAEAMIVESKKREKTNECNSSSDS